MKKLIEHLQQIQADCAVLYFKLHNFHWNVKGMDFHPIHKATEEAYENITDLMDDVAERILQLGEKPLVTLKSVLEVAKIKEESAVSFDSKTIIKAILADYEYLLKNFKTLSDEADRANDKGTVSLADEHIASLEKSIWMLKAHLA